MSGDRSDAAEPALRRKIVCAIVVALFAIGIGWLVTTRSAPPPPPNPVGLEPG